MRVTNDRPATGEPTDRRRVSVPEAAILLGISEDAVRSRLRRGTLEKEKTPDGTVFVILDGDRPTTSPGRQMTGEPTDHNDPLTEALRDQVEMLRDQLDKEREANRENRRIIAALVQRVPELEAPPEASDSLVTATGGPGGDISTPEPERPTWWQRIFGAS